MKPLLEHLTNLFVVLGFTFPIALFIMRPGGEWSNNRYRDDCRELISKYYQIQNSSDFCQDPCTSKNLFNLINIYDGKIDLNQAYEIARKKCEKKK